MIRIIRIINEAQELHRRARRVRLAEAERIVAPILEAVRTRGDAALLEYARKFDGFEGTSRARPRGMRSAASRTSGVPRGRDDRRGEHPRVRAAATAARDAGWIIRTAARWARSCGRSIRWAPTFPRAVIRCLHAADDRDSGAGGRRQDHLRRLPASERRRFWASRSCWASRRSSRWAARRRSRRWRSAPRPFRAWIASSGPGTSMSPPRRSCSRAKSGSISSPDRPRS